MLLWFLFPLWHCNGKRRCCLLRWESGLYLTLQGNAGWTFLVLHDATLAMCDFFQRPCRIIPVMCRCKESCLCARLCSWHLVAMHDSTLRGYRMAWACERVSSLNHSLILYMTAVVWIRLIGMIGVIHESASTYQIVCALLGLHSLVVLSEWNLVARVPALDRNVLLLLFAEEAVLDLAYGLRLVLICDPSGEVWDLRCHGVGDSRSSPVSRKLRSWGWTVATVRAGYLLLSALVTSLAIKSVSLSSLLWITHAQWIDSVIKVATSLSFNPSTKQVRSRHPLILWFSTPGIVLYWLLSLIIRLLLNQILLLSGCLRHLTFCWYHFYSFRLGDNMRVTMRNRLFAIIEFSLRSHCRVRHIHVSCRKLVWRVLLKLMKLITW